MKLLEKVWSEDCAEFQAFRDWKNKIAEAKNRLNGITAFRLQLEQTEAKLRTECFGNATLENFTTWVSARRELTDVTEAEQLLYQSKAWVADRFETHQSGSSEVLLAVLTVARDRLGKIIEKLNAEEAVRLEKAGLPPGEHPSITQLKEEFTKLAEAIHFIKMIEPDYCGQAPWRMFANLVKL